MRQFAGLPLSHGPVPDETTILNFRHFLERHNLSAVGSVTPRCAIAAWPRIPPNGTCYLPWPTSGWRVESCCRQTFLKSLITLTCILQIAEIEPDLHFGRTCHHTLHSTQGRSLILRSTDFALHCERNLIDRFFGKLEDFGAIATRYDKPAGTLLAPIQPVSALFASTDDTL